MKNIVYVIIAVAAVILSSTRSGNIETPPAIISPVEGGFARLDGGKTLVIQNGFSVRFFDSETGEKSEIVLMPKTVRSPKKCSFSNRLIFLPGEESSFVPSGSKAKLFGCCFFNRNGDIFKESVPASDEARAAVPIDRAFFIGDGLLVIKSGPYEFIYNIDTDEIKSAQRALFLF